MSNPSNEGEKGGQNVDRDLAKLVKEIFNSDGKVIQAREEDLAIEDQIYYNPLRRAVIDAIDALLDHMMPYLMQVLKELLEEEEKDNTSQQSTSSS